MNRRTGGSDSRALIIFARYPHAGQVKSRLASTLGSEWATLFYRRCAESVFAEAERVCCCRYLFYADEADMKQMQEWAGPHFLYVLQRDGDLGKRMASAFDYVFDQGHSGAIIVGTDIPDLTAGMLTAAFQLLDQDDIAIGPAKDGGYYLLGMRQLYQELFVDIPWSTSTVFNQTIQVVERLGLQISYLPTLTDIDTEADLRHWVATSSIPSHFQPLLTNLPHN